jgi:hypothetical protein
MAVVANSISYGDRSGAARLVLDESFGWRCTDTRAVYS